MAARSQVPPALVTLLLVVIGVAFVTNPFWLYPNNGETRYTYERAVITVENGTLTYEGADAEDFARANDLDDVGCQPRDERGRACAFDSYLADAPPVTVPNRSFRTEGPTFVELEDGYYRRLRTDNESGMTYDVERVPHEELLSEVSTDISHANPGELSGDVNTATRVAVTGEPVTSLEPPATEDAAGVDTGSAYEINGSYYTVVVADQGVIDNPLLSSAGRLVLELVGVLFLLGAFLRVSDRVR